MKNVPTAEASPGEELVTVLRPGNENDVTYLSPAGGVRFVEGRAHDVPFAVARAIVGPGWIIKPQTKLQRTEGITK